MDKTARGTNVIVFIRVVKHVMMNIDKSHAQIRAFIFKKIGSNTNGETRLFLINCGFESLPDEASVS